jgi:hypothetical protein
VHKAPFEPGARLVDLELPCRLQGCGHAPDVRTRSRSGSPKQDAAAAITAASYYGSWCTVACDSLTRSRRKAGSFAAPANFFATTRVR